MDRFLKAIKYHAGDNDRAANIFLDTYGMSKEELADYVVSHDDELRELLGVKYLVEKDGNPELSKEYFDLLQLGRNIRNPDKLKKQGFYGEDRKDVDYYMGKLGVQKEDGEYNDDIRSAFTNPKNPAYFGNYNRDELANLAHVEGLKGDVDALLEQMRRTGDEYQRQNQARGYDANNEVTASWLLDLGEQIVLPRVREAKLAGQPATWKDFTGDLAELGLNFVPGLGIVNSATGRLVAKLPTTARLLSNIGLNAIESAAAPLGSQALDKALYNKDDPRGNWDLERIGAQYAGAIGAKGAIKLGAGNIKNAAELAEGAQKGGSTFRDAMATIESIGEDARNNIARRKLAQERKLEMANDRKYKENNSFLTPEQNKTGVFYTIDDALDAQDFLIQADEAERLARSQSARTKYAKYGNAYDDAFERKINAEEDLQALQAAKRNGEQVSDKALQKAEEDVATANANLEKIGDKYAKAEEEFRSKNKSYVESILDDNPNARLSGANPDVDAEIVQLPDGRLAYNKGGVVGGIKLGDYRVNAWAPFGELKEGGVPSEVTVLKPHGTSLELDNSIKIGEPDLSQTTQTVKSAYRDLVVRKRINSDKDLAAVASSEAKKQKYVNTTANALFNAAAREGWAGQGLDLEEKRQAALWNQQLAKLRPLVTEGDKSPEGKKKMVNAIMNVMTYGLDNLPEDMYKQDRLAYKAIAKQLGSDDWSHWSDHPVPDYPTTSK